MGNATLGTWSCAHQNEYRHLIVLVFGQKGQSCRRTNVCLQRTNECLKLKGMNTQDRMCICWLGVPGPSTSDPHITFLLDSQACSLIRSTPSGGIVMKWKLSLFPLSHLPVKHWKCQKSHSTGIYLLNSQRVITSYYGTFSKDPFDTRSTSKINVICSLTAIFLLPSASSHWKPLLCPLYQWDYMNHVCQT